VMDWRKNGVKIIHAAEMDMNTPQTSGMTRAAAITHAKAGATTCGLGPWSSSLMRRRDRTTMESWKPSCTC